MKSIKNKIINSLIKNNYIKSKKDIKSFKHIDIGLINYIFSVQLKNKPLIAKYATNFSRFNPKIKINKDRLEKELQAINLFSSLIKKNHFPSIEYYDKENDVLVMEKIASKYKSLDDDIFAGTIDLSFPKKLGIFLAELHNLTAYNKNIEKQFSDTGMLKNYKFPVIYKNLTNDPLLQKEINILKKQLLNNKICLLHSDFKPNNIFYTTRHFYIIDFEQSHYGDPALDVCYSPAMYFLAMMKNYSKADDYYYCIESFWNAYSKKSKFKNLKKLEKNSLKHLGVVILSRTFGISKIESLQKPRIKKIISNISKKLILGEINSFDTLKYHAKKFM